MIKIKFTKFKTLINSISYTLYTIFIMNKKKSKFLFLFRFFYLKKFYILKANLSKKYK